MPYKKKNKFYGIFRNTPSGVEGYAEDPLSMSWSKERVRIWREVDLFYFKKERRFDRQNVFIRRITSEKVLPYLTWDGRMRNARFSQSISVRVVGETVNTDWSNQSENRAAAVSG